MSNNGIKIGSVIIDTHKTANTITLGKISLKTEYVIELYTNEGKNIAHFHMTPKDGSKIVCVQLYSAKYFQHGDNKDGTLNSDGCKVLNDFLNKTCTLSENKDFNYNNWQFMVYKWRLAHNEPCTEDNMKELSKRQPNYTNIADYR